MGRKTRDCLMSRKDSKKTMHKLNIGTLAKQLENLRESSAICLSEGDRDLLPGTGQRHLLRREGCR